MSQKLEPAQVSEQLALLPGWRQEGQLILKKFSLPSFPAALVFVNAVGHLAEALNHHPDIHIQWRHVTISVSTHDAGGLTQKDFDLARLIEGLPMKAS
jgi:4a-hydroxytetrahydrobiopterin dehydratase